MTVDGRPSRLELTTDAGLLTLHPAAGGRALHGNTATATGVLHHELPWSDAHVLVVVGSPVTAAAAASLLAARFRVGEGGSVPVGEVGAGLAVRRATWRAARVGERRWLLLAADTGLATSVVLDEDGGLAGFEDARRWPLERAAAG